MQQLDFIYRLHCYETLIVKAELSPKCPIILSFPKPPNSSKQNF